MAKRPSAVRRSAARDAVQTDGVDNLGGVRLDKWLWAARFFKTRGLAQQAIEAGHVLLAGQKVKLARALRVGDEISIRIGGQPRVVRVQALSDQRGPAPVAQKLYQETAESIRSRLEQQALRAMQAEPADAIGRGRPTKRDRRLIQRLRQGD
ncbi:MAG: S4 domain-containing protein [Quisquiliibacterium sp.]